MTDISVLIVAKNDTDHLLQAIDSVVQWTTEVIIVDIGIRDDFLEKLKKTNVKIIPHNGNIMYADQIRDKITLYTSSTYILFLDPDEILPPALQKYIQKNYKKYDAMAFSRKNIIFDKWMQHARWWPDYQIRLYKKDKGNWNPSIHSKPNIKGVLHEIPAQETLAILHYNYNNLDHYFEKMIRYAKSEAADYIQSNTHFTLTNALSKGMQEFVSRFFSAEGYKDGMHGFVLSFLQSVYYPFVYFSYGRGKNIYLLNSLK